MYKQESVGERGSVMLKQFKFRNCYSFKNETILSMKAERAMKDNVDFVIKKGPEGHEDLILPVAAIYGANAGGKSNTIRALRDAAKNICERKEQMLNRCFYLTDIKHDEFEHSLTLLIGEYEYIYSYTANTKEVIKESLERGLIGCGEFEVVFSRNRDTLEDKTILDSFDFSSIKNAAKNTEYLIVNSVATLDIPGCSDIYRWCKSVLAVTLIKSQSERELYLDTFANEIADNHEVQERLGKFMCNFDTAVAGVVPYNINRNTQGEKEYVLAITHNYRKVDGSEGKTYFGVALESSGTQKILELYSILSDALDNGKPLVIDELDTFLHPLVFKKIVALFNDKETNPKNAQLIFAAHNTEIMNREDLRRDEIHIIEKDDDGISSIFRLSDFVYEDGKKVRMDARYDRLYLEGLLGSIPSAFEDAVV